MNALNEVIGGRDLCAWQPVPGVCWVQARSPQFARKLAQRADSRLVARGVAGGYLRIFKFNRSIAWAGRLLARYTRNGMATNALIKPPASPASLPQGIRRVMAAGRPIKALDSQTSTA
jgi:hypothetical protein